jgi:hypothetical protein
VERETLYARAYVSCFQDTHVVEIAALQRRAKRVLLDGSRSVLTDSSVRTLYLSIVRFRFLPSESDRYPVPVLFFFLTHGRTLETTVVEKKGWRKRARVACIKDITKEEKKPSVLHVVCILYS